MSHFFVPTKSSEDWKQLLAEPEKQWREGYSAKSVADSWQGACGFPETVSAVFSSSAAPELSALEFVCGFPEFQVPLPGGSRPSQTDLMVISRSATGLTVIAVEAKAEESFGSLVSEWTTGESEGKVKRLGFLLGKLNLPDQDVGSIRYQLLHRTVSALLTAEQFHCNSAIMLVHSFSPERTGFSDYSKFLSLIGVSAEVNLVQPAGDFEGVQLSFAWVTDQHKNPA